MVPVNGKPQPVPRNVFRYDIDFSNGEWTDLEIELHMIRKGGQWTREGQVFGKGLFYHYKELMRILWPDDMENRWADTCLKAMVENTVSVLIGPADSGKTWIASKWALMEYWIQPKDTLVVVSSTDMRGLELRVWGAIKDLFNRARELHPDLPGHPIEYLHCITHEHIEEGKARVLGRGIICIPCLQGGHYVGLGKYHGIKRKRLRMVSDESQLMGPSHLDSLPNYLGKDFRGVFLGNPLDVIDPLGMIAEPECGWTALPEPTKTTTWKTKMLDGFCVNLVGTDSPNFDHPQDQPPKYPFFINRLKLETVEKFWGKDSQQYYSQCIGVMKTGLLEKRIITRDLCVQHHALDKAYWSGTERTKVYAIDAAYRGTGGDRCVGGWGEFGKSNEGTIILRVNPPVIIPVSIRLEVEPEDQIAAYAKRDIEAATIPVENIFYDSTGRGTLGSAFARCFGERTPVPVEFGGGPSARPVRHDLFVREENGEQRHKMCKEHYFNFITELYFSARYAIESDQIRELPIDVMREGCGRSYGTRAGNKFVVESKTDEKFKKLMRGVSPDLFDWFVTLVEGARQRGFVIQRLGVAMVEQDSSDWFEEEERKYRGLLKSKLLTHA